MGVGADLCWRGVSPRRGVALVHPGRRIVDPLGRIVAAEEAVVEVVAVLHEEGGVGVVAHVLVVDEVLLQHVVDEPPKNATSVPVRIRAWMSATADVRVNRDRRGSSWPRRPSRCPLGVELGLHEPLEADRMRLAGWLR
jgi:hypothetical protein